MFLLKVNLRNVNRKRKVILLCAAIGVQWVEFIYGTKKSSILFKK